MNTRNELGSEFKGEQELVLKSRSELALDGVEDVIDFDETLVTILIAFKAISRQLFAELEAVSIFSLHNTFFYAKLAVSVQVGITSIEKGSTAVHK